MNSKALVLAAATTGVAVVTLVALNLVAPITHAEEAKAEGITADQVFSASIGEPGTSAPASTASEPSSGQVEVALAQDAGAAAASESASSTPPAEAAAATSDEPQAPAVAGGSCAMGAGGGKPIVVPAAGAPAAGDSPAPAMEVAQAETAPAPEPEPAPSPEPAAAPAPEPEAAPAEAAAPPPDEHPSGGSVTEAAGACPTGLHDPNAKPVVVVAQGAPGGPASAPPSDAVDPLASSEVAIESHVPAEPEPAPSPAAEPAPPAPAPEPAAAPEPKPEPAAAPAPKPKPKAAAKPAAPKKAPPEAKVAWWPAKEAGKLNVVYAGEASFTKAIVVMFDGQFDNADGANQNIKVTPKKGGEVKGKWMVANGNPSMLLLDVAPGLYTIEIGSGLADKGGRAVSAASTGAVFIH